MFRHSNATASVRLPRSPRCGTIARHVLEEELAPIVSSEQLSCAKTVVSELANNAYVHGVGRIDLTITRLTDRVRIEVSDQGYGVDAVRADPSHGLGYGLAIVDSLSLNWGAETGRSQVWAEFGR